MSVQERINVWGGTAARVECLSLELIRVDNECEILLQSTVRGMIAGRNTDPPGAVEAFSKHLVTCCWESFESLWWGGGELRRQPTSLSKRKSSSCSANLEEEWSSCCSSVSSLCWQELFSPEAQTSSALWYLLSSAVFGELKCFHWCSAAQWGFVLWSRVGCWVKCPVSSSCTSVLSVAAELWLI